MPQRATHHIEPPREGPPDKPSQLLIGTMIAAVASTVLLAVMWYLDSRPRQPPPAGWQGLPLPPPATHNPVLLSVGLFTISWVAVIVAACRDQTLQQIAEIRRLVSATLDLVEQRDTDAFLRGMRTAAQAQKPVEPPPGTGEVVPLHRPPPADDK